MKSADAFRTIGEAADDLDLPQHVLRFWETRFPQIDPLKRAGGRRYYRPDDMQLLRAIRFLLYDEGRTIKGVQQLLRARGVAAVIALGGVGAEVPVADLTAGVPENAGLFVPPQSQTPSESKIEFDLPLVIQQLRRAQTALAEARAILVPPDEPDL